MHNVIHQLKLKLILVTVCVVNMVINCGMNYEDKYFALIKYIYCLNQIYLLSFLEEKHI